MTLPNILILAVASLVLGGCATFEGTRQIAERNDVRCDLAVDEGLAISKRTAVSLAEEGARHQYGEVRGYLLSRGLKRVRIENRETRCRPHPLVAGFVHCTATVRLCGR